MRLIAAALLVVSSAHIIASQNSAATVVPVGGEKPYKNGTIRIVLVDKADEWLDPGSDQIFRASAGHVFLGVHLEHAFTGDRLSLTGLAVADSAGVTYQSKRPNVTIFGSRDGGILKGQTSFAFEVPTTVKIQTLVVGPDTSFDIGELTRNAVVEKRLE